ncbi:MAG TPA: hypothetical protein VGH38_22825 [Bryobacteraceae bacterium]
MSLIVSRASKDYVLQVSGQPAGTPTKQRILYSATNGIAALGYAGMDSIAGTPAARWLAASLPYPRDLGGALHTLAQSLSTVRGDPKWTRDWLPRDFDVHVVGWQWSRNRYRPVVAGVSKAPGSTAFRIEYLPRYWHLDRGRPGPRGRRGFRFNVTAAPDTHISRPQLQSVVNRLRDIGPDDAENVIASTLRELSHTNPDTGPHCLSILLHPPPIARARVRFLAGLPPPESAASPSGNGHGHVLVAASPWLIGPSGISPPVPLTGRTELRLGTYVVSMEVSAAW